VTSIFSIICVVLLACHTLIFAIKWPTANTISLAFLAPSFGIFFHYYDLAPALTFCLVFQLATMPRLSSLAMLAIFIIPENFQDASSMSLLFTILMIYCLKIYLSRIKDVITYFLLALVSWLIYAVFVSVLSKFFGIHEIAVTCAIFLSTSVAFQQMKMSNH
jgi:hypothetical protein